jgi:hypothetical protein
VLDRNAYSNAMLLIRSATKYKTLAVWSSQTWWDVCDPATWDHGCKKNTLCIQFDI